MAHFDFIKCLIGSFGIDYLPFRAVIMKIIQGDVFYCLYISFPVKAINDRFSAITGLLKSF